MLNHVETYTAIITLFHTVQNTIITLCHTVQNTCVETDGSAVQM